jgi:hypothetical protein
MSNEYQLVDGGYGTRHDDAATPQQTRPVQATRVEETAEAAARLGLDHPAAAIDRRLTSSWAEKEGTTLQALRAEHPEELTGRDRLPRPRGCMVISEANP